MVSSILDAKETWIKGQSEMGGGQRSTQIICDIRLYTKSNYYPAGNLNFNAILPLQIVFCILNLQRDEVDQMIVAIMREFASHARVAQ